jgi:hypothetical protein
MIEYSYQSDTGLGHHYKTRNVLRGGKLRYKFLDTELSFLYACFMDYRWGVRLVWMCT